MCVEYGNTDGDMCTHAFIGRLLTDKTDHLTFNAPGLLVFYWSDEAMDFHTGN